MSDFTHIGRAVTHTAWPRFTMVFKPSADGGWEGGDVKLLDDVPANMQATKLARLMRLAGDYWAAHLRDDWIREVAIARAAELGLTSYEIAKRTAGAVSEDHVHAYLTRRHSMTSELLQHVLRVLGLDIVVKSGH